MVSEKVPVHRLALMKKYFLLVLYCALHLCHVATHVPDVNKLISISDCDKIPHTFVALPNGVRPKPAGVHP